MSYLTTDHDRRSQLDYGTPGFPFACYRDNLTQYESRCIEWHWHNEFEFSCVTEGIVLCHIGTDCVRLHAGDALFINSGVIHRFETPEHGILTSFIFSPEFIAEATSTIYAKFIHPFYSSSFSCATFQHGSDHANPLLGQLQKLYSVCFSGIPGKELQIQNLVSGLWIQFFEQSAGLLPDVKTKETQITQERLHTMLTFVRTNYFCPIRLADIAASANISKSEALRCFRTGIGRTPVNYLNEYRLTQAAKLLCNTSAPITAISESTGLNCKLFLSGIPEAVFFVSCRIPSQPFRH